MVSYYRKYRPQTATELDLDVVRAFFERILQSGQVSHAYLFTGPKGAGKTSAARILAKIVNCEKNRQVARSVLPVAGDEKSATSLLEPCNKCEVCVSITNGNNMDVMEIDAASNRGIDDIRELRERVGLAPAAIKRKVYIIDEVHMLTTEAFNALLKTLEEPPDHVMFVLATTEAHKVPETIMSRCVRLHFPQATSVEVARSLGKAVRGEKLKVEAGVLEAIARVADGSFREAMKLLEQLALGGNEISLKRTEAELGQSSVFSPGVVLQALIMHDRAKAIEELQRLEQQGVNWQVFVRQGLETLREELLLMLKVESANKLAGNLKGLTQEQLQLLISRWLMACREMKDAPIVQLPLELLVAEWCSRADARIENEKLKIENDRKQITGVEQANGLVSEQTMNEPAKTEEPKTDNRKPTTDNRQPRAGGKPIKFEELVSRWKEVLQAVRPHNHSLEGLLRSTKLTEIIGNKLRIEVFYQFHLDQLKQDRFLRVVEGAIVQVVGGEVRLEYYLGSKPKRQVAAPVENITADVADDDILKAAEEIFGAE